MICSGKSDGLGRCSKEALQQHCHAPAAVVQVMTCQCQPQQLMTTHSTPHCHTLAHNTPHTSPITLHSSLITLTPPPPLHNQDDLKLGKLLGSGGFGSVYKATLREEDGSDTPVIVKKVSSGGGGVGRRGCCWGVCEGGGCFWRGGAQTAARGVTQSGQWGGVRVSWTHREG